MSIEEIKNQLRIGDITWIAENLEGNLKSNRMHISRVLSGKVKGTAKKAKRIIDLALLRIDINKAAEKTIKALKIADRTSPAKSVAS